MRPKLKPLNEQTIVVTGASSGIGLTIAKRAAAAGARVMLSARNEDALREARDQIRAQGGGAGRMMTATNHLAPGLSDQIFSFLFFKLAKGGEKRNDASNLHQAGDDGNQYGDQRFMRRHSMYTAMQTHPKATLGLAVLGGAATVGVAAAMARRSGRRYAVREAAIHH